MTHELYKSQRVDTDGETPGGERVPGKRCLLFSAFLVFELLEANAILGTINDAKRTLMFLTKARRASNNTLLSFSIIIHCPLHINSVSHIPVYGVLAVTDGKYERGKGMGQSNGVARQYAHGHKLLEFFRVSSFDIGDYAFSPLFNEARGATNLSPLNRAF